MGVRILKRSYGNAFAPSGEEKPDWLIGNVGDWLRLNMEVEAGVDFLATQQNPVSVDKEERSIKLMNGKKWSDYGFDYGAQVSLTFKVDTTDANSVTTTETFLIPFVIEQLFNDTLIYAQNDDMNDIPYETMPTDRGTVRVYSVKFFDSREAQGIRMKYANINNSDVESHTLNSFIDGTETEMIYVGLNNISQGSGYQNMTLIGNQSGMSINGARIRKIGQTNLPIYDQFFSSGQPLRRLVCFRPNQFSSNRKVRHSWAIPSFSANQTTDYQNVGSNLDVPTLVNNGSTTGNYTTGQANRCFMFNANQASTKQFDLNFKFWVQATNKVDPSCYVRLVLVKYKNGASMTFDGVQELYRWNNGEFPLGVPLYYQDTLIKNINVGDSYAIALEWNHSAINTTQRYIDALVLSMSCNVFDIVGGFQSYKRKYEIEVDFMLSSFFEEITDLETHSPPQVVFDASSLTDAIKLTFLPEWNNPNIKIENDMKETERLGNTGWFDENYNGLPNNFEVKSVQYFDLGGQSVTGLSYGSDVKVKAVIGGIANLAVDSDFKHGFIWLPKDEEQYKNKLTPFHKNTKISCHFNTSAFNANTAYPFTYDGYATDNAKMNTRAISYTIQGNDLVFEAVFSPTPEFLQYFQDKADDRKYALWVSVADRNLMTAFSDRVSLLLDVNDMDFFIPISGELEGVTTSFIEHPEDHLATGVEVYDGFLEDDILARSFFSLENGKRLSQMILGYEVENVTSGSTYELERFTANLQPYVTIPSGVQEIDFNSERGYKLEPNNNKNWVKVVRNPNGDQTGKAGYQILFGQKIRWEYWLQKTNVPSEYYDNTLEFNGSNNDWLHFLRESNSHKINFFILFDVQENGETKRYKNIFPITFNGYDENTNIETTHQYFDNETNALLNVGTEPESGRPLGVLLSNKNTRIEISYKKLNGDWDLGNVYAVTTIEIDRGAGVMTHRQLSSIVGSENDNILIPLPPNTKLLVQQIAPNVIKTTCLVDYTRLQNAFMYKITGRIGCFANDNGVPISQRIYDEADYEPNYE